MASIPLPETSRAKLIGAFVGDVRAWKADDAAETVIIAVKDPSRDANNQSVYTATKAQLLAGQLTYQGTTQRGKDGGPSVIVFNDGTTVMLNPEAPLAGDSGNLADLYAIVLAQRLPAELAPASGAVDTTARAWIRQIAQGIIGVLAPWAK